MSNPKEKDAVKLKIEKLIAKINRWNYFYYQLSDPQVSDQVYDQCFQELKYLEEKYPEFVFDNSPTKRVGHSASNTFRKVKHDTPMLSLNNAFKKEDLYAFDKRIKKITNGQHTYYCEPKIDGLPVSMVFKNNYFLTAATRGDGFIGENVTRNIKHIALIKNNLFKKYKIDNFCIRGEVFLTKQNFYDLNLNLSRKKKIEFETKINQKKQYLKNLIDLHFEKYELFFLNDISELPSQKTNKIFVQNLNNSFFDEIEEFERKKLIKWKLFLLKTDKSLSIKIKNVFRNQKQFLFKDSVFLNSFIQFELSFWINFSFNKFSNPRNAASGSLKQLNFQITAERNLSLIFYNFFQTNPSSFPSQNQIIDNLKSMGFPISNYNKHCENIEEVFNYIEKIKKEREEIPYETDGVVIKVNEHKFYSLIKSTERAPGHSIAYKYPTKQVETKLIKIFPTVGRTGRITYNAKLKKIFLSGSYVSAATLHNAEYIEKKDIREEDFVFITKAGEIIPKVLDVNKLKRPLKTLAWKRNLTCPSCKSVLQNLKPAIDQYCINSECAEKKLQSWIHFVGRDAMNIVGLNSRTIKGLIEFDLLNDFSDLFLLKEKRDVVLSLSKKTKQLSLASKSIDNLLQEIEKSKRNSLERLLFAINIRYVGIRAAKILARRFQKIEKLFFIKLDDLINIDGFGPTLTRSIVAFFSSQDNINMILKLQKLGINTDYLMKTVNNYFFKNKRVVITGVFELSRQSLIQKLEMFQATVLKSVSKNIDFLIVGSNPGSKLAKAQELKIKLISADKLKQLFS